MSLLARRSVRALRVASARLVPDPQTSRVTVGGPVDVGTRRGFSSASSSTPRRFTADDARRYHERAGRQMLVPWVEALVELSLPAPENVVLDLASGTGACAHVLAREIGTTNSTGRVVALDASRGMLEVARERDAALRAAPDAPPLAPVAFDFADACDPDAPWHETRLRAFDRAYCHQGLQHFANPAEALARVRKSLKPGGQFACAVWAHVDHQPLHRAARDALVDVDKPEWAHILTGPDSDLSWGGDKPDTSSGRSSAVSVPAAVAEMESILVDAGFDAPDAAAERGFAYFDHLEDAAGFVLAEPFGEALRGDETLWRSYVAAFERRLDETAGGEMRFVARDVAEAGWGAIAKMRSRGEEEAGGGANAEGSKLAVPVVAIFGHATAPWH